MRTRNETAKKPCGESPSNALQGDGRGESGPGKASGQLGDHSGNDVSNHLAMKEGLKWWQHFCWKEKVEPTKV